MGYRRVRTYARAVVQLAMLLVYDDAASCVLHVSMARGVMRAVQEQLVMLLCKVTASHACRCGSTTKEHGAVGAACGLPACAYIRESGGAAALLLLYDDAASYVPPVCMACGVMRAVQSSL